MLLHFFTNSNHYMPVIVSTEDIAGAQSQNQELQSLLESKISLELCKLCLDNTERTIYCDISGDDVHSYIPSFLKQKIFDITRCLSHPGVRVTKQLITRRFVWPSINKLHTGSRHVFLANERRSNVTITTFLNTLKFQTRDFIMCTLILFPTSRKDKYWI